MNARTISLVLILLIASCYGFWIRPQATKLTTTKTKLQTVQQEIVAINGARLSISDSTSTSDLDQKLLEDAIPQGLDQDNLIKLLKSNADQYQVNIVSANFNQAFAETSNQIKSAQISLTANGNPSSVKAFLSSLENSNRGFFVKNISMSFGIVNDVEVSNLNLTLEAFFS